MFGLFFSFIPSHPIESHRDDRPGGVPPPYAQALRDNYERRMEARIRAARHINDLNVSFPIRLQCYTRDACRTDRYGEGRGWDIPIPGVWYGGTMPVAYSSFTVMLH